MANPIQQGLKPGISGRFGIADEAPAMANPIQQGLKRNQRRISHSWRRSPAMANPIQQGLKPHTVHHAHLVWVGPRNG